MLRRLFVVLALATVLVMSNPSDSDEADPLTRFSGAAHPPSAPRFTSSTPITLRVGDHAALELPANPTTGYSWVN